MLEEKEGMNIDLQLFAEDGGNTQENNDSSNQDNNEGSKNNQNNQDSNKNNVDDNKKEEKITKLEERLEKMSKMLENLTPKKEEKKDESKKKDNKEKSDVEKELEKLKNEVKMKDLENMAEKTLVKEGLSDHMDSLLPIVMTDDAEKITENIKTLKTIIEKSAQKKIDDLKKGKGIQGNSDLSKDQIDKEVEMALGGIGDSSNLDDFWK